MSAPIALSDSVVSEADVEAVLDVYRSGWLTMGPRTQEFEAAFAAAIGAEHAVAVSSAGAGLHLSLLAAGIGPGDEVLVAAIAPAATAAAVRACGAVPVPCDATGPEDLLVDPADVASRVSERSRAIVASHWWGYAADVAAMSAVAREHGLALVEDTSHALWAQLGDGSGRRAGTAGLAGSFSFSDTQLSVGEGGMVVSDDAGVAGRVRSLRSHAMTSVTWDRHRGHAASYDVLDVGYNFRLDEPRAALGLSRLPRLDDDVERRRAMVRAYRAALGAVGDVLVPWSDAEVERSSHFAFGVLLPDARTRDRVRAALADQRVGTDVHPSAGPSVEDADAAPLPVSRQFAARHLVLPLASTYGRAEAERVVAALRAAL